MRYKSWLILALAGCQCVLLSCVSNPVFDNPVDPRGTRFLDTSALERSIRVEEDSLQVTQEPPGAWGRVFNASASGNFYISSATSGQRVRFVFMGTGASVIVKTDSCGGEAKVEVDSNITHIIDTYMSLGQWQARLDTIKGLADGQHTLTVTVLGTKRAASCEARIYLDAFEYSP